MIGVGIAIDDFGTGYSSLSYLQDFPVTSVKIDQSFVAGLSAAGDSGLVGSIIALGDALGLTTVAEGVETAGQLNELVSLSCDLAQGFHLGYPQRPHQVLDLVRRSADTSENGRPESASERHDLLEAGS